LSRRSALLALGGLAASALVSAGCASSPRGGLDELRRSVEGYNEAYRWKNYERAAAFLPGELRPAFLASYEEDDKSLHVEGYQILAVDLKRPNLADVTVRFRYMQLPSVTLEKKVVTQHWAKVNDRWVLEHEDNPIRPVDPDAASGEAGFGGPTPAATMEVEVRDPDGNVVDRRTGAPKTREGD
jgi:hypothetical protein